MLHQPKPSEPHPLPLFDNTGNTLSTAELKRLAPDQLSMLYTSARSYLTRNNNVPRSLRATVNGTVRARNKRAANLKTRIVKVARAQRVTLPDSSQGVTLPQIQLSSDFRKGDRVHATFRNPNSAQREIVECDGEIERIEIGRVGSIYFTRLDTGDVVPLDRSCLKPIS